MEALLYDPQPSEEQLLFPMLVSHAQALPPDIQHYFSGDVIDLAKVLSLLPEFEDKTRVADLFSQELRQHDVKVVRDIVMRFRRRRGSLTKDQEIALRSIAMNNIVGTEIFDEFWHEAEPLFLAEAQNNETLFQNIIEINQVLDDNLGKKDLLGNRPQLPLEARVADIFG